MLLFPFICNFQFKNDKMSQLEEKLKDEDIEIFGFKKRLYALQKEHSLYMTNIASMVPLCLFNNGVDVAERNSRTFM